MDTCTALTPFWPVFGLRLRTPRLELRPVADDDLADLVGAAAAGVHPADEMPFLVPWTDAPAEELPADLLRYHWSVRGVVAPERWRLEFVVRESGVVVGVQGLGADRFAVTRTVQTGSWLGRVAQGRGVGTEMRAAVLLLAFDQLGAERAESSAFVDNRASLRVSEKLGYRPDGIAVHVRRGRRADDQRLALTPDSFVRPDWTLQVDGLEACRGQLGVDRPSA